MQITKNEQVDLALRQGETLTAIGKRLGFTYSQLKDMTGQAKVDRVARAAAVFQSIRGSK